MSDVCQPGSQELSRRLLVDMRHLERSPGAGEEKLQLLFLKINFKTK